MKNRFAATQRRRAFGLISHITPVALPIFLVLFYAPFIAAPLRAHGWNKGASLAAGFAVPIGWLLLGALAVSVIPQRFAKLKSALEIGVLGIPFCGMFALLLWVVLRLILQIVR